MIVLGILIFGMAMALSIYAIYATVAPQLDHIVEALSGQPQSKFARISPRMLAERRLAVRRWAAASRSAELRAAA